jgi:hypothetical protein
VRPLLFAFGDLGGLAQHGQLGALLFGVVRRV